MSITSTKNSFPFISKGIGIHYDQFVSGRISVGFSGIHHGLSHVSYIGKQEIHRLVLFSSLVESYFGKLFRTQPVIDGAAYVWEPRDTTLLSCGIISHSTFKDVELEYVMLLDKDKLYQRCRIVSNPRKRDVKFRLLQHNHLFKSAEGRKVESWKIQNDQSLRAVISEPGGEIVVCLECDQKYHSLLQGKFYLETESLDTEATFTLSFDGRPDFDVSDRIDQLLSELTRKVANGIRFDTGDPIVDSALNNVIPTLDCLKIPDRPGALRASQHYWVWGWDSMVHAEAFLWGGESDFVRDMLDFYRETAHPEKGVIHWVDASFAPKGCMRFYSQGLYAVMLGNYYAATGDKETVMRNYEFTKMILERASVKKHEKCSLGIEDGFFPDHPKCLGQTDDCISLINNSLYYQALRAMEDLSAQLGFMEDSAKYRRSAAEVKIDMDRILWDDKEGYWSDYADGKTLLPQPVYPLYGQLHVSPYANEPHDKDVVRMAEFLKREFPFEHGLTMYPSRRPGFMADGNQLGAYYAPTDRYYWNKMNDVNDPGSEDFFKDIVRYYWSEHTYPEGLTHETANEDPTVDNPGCKQAFTMRGFFCDALELNLGLRVYQNGFTLHPLKSEKPFRVYNLSLHNDLIDIERTAGHHGEIYLNGKKIDGIIEWGMLREKNQIEIR